MSKPQYINICFLDRDKELIAWANMIRENGQSINTWVQAILLAEAVGENLDAGAVFIPKSKPKASSVSAAMFGDDRSSAEAKEKKSSGWQIRGENGEIVAGSIISIRVTRPVMTALLDSLSQSHKRIGPYAKAVVRRKIRKLGSGPDVPPDESQAQDIFALYEDRYITDAGRQEKDEPTVQHRAEPSQYAAPQRQGQNAPNGNSVPAGKNQQRRDGSSYHQNRNNRNNRQQQPPQPQSPQRKDPPQQPEHKDGVAKGKKPNPLLGYIN